MKSALRILLFAGMLNIISSGIHAQIVNSIAYYSTIRGNCGLPSFSPDTLYSAALSGGIRPYTFIWEKSLDGTNYTPVGGPHQGDSIYKPDPITQVTWIRRTAISGVDTSHSNAYEFYTNLQPIQNNVIFASKALSIPCGTSTYAPGLLNSTDTIKGGVSSGGGSINYGYQWFYSTDGVNFKQVAFSNASSYTPGNITSDTWFERVVFSPQHVCVDTSNVVHFTFAGLPGNTLIPPSITAACNAQVFKPGQIIGSNPGTGTTYQWQLGTDSLHFANISGAITQNYTPDSIKVSTYYRRKASLNGCASYSHFLLFSVAPPFSLDSISSNQRIDSATAPALLVGNLVTSGTNTVQYLWKISTDSVNFSPAPGTNNGTNYQAPSLSVKTFFQREAFLGNCSVISNIVVIGLNKVTVIKPPPPNGCSNIAQSANLGVKIFNRPNNKPTGAQYDYSIAITNFGPGTATNVVVTDTLPAILQYISGSSTQGTLTTSGQIVTWTIPSLAPLATEGIIITVNPTVNDQIINSVFVKGKECDPLLSNNKSTDTLNNPIPNLLAKDIPDIITPNGDGFNDSFTILDFLGIPALSDNELLIFDRWGNAVYHTKSYQNDWTGNGLSAGTYFYVLRINNGTRTQTFKGHITLLR